MNTFHSFSDLKKKPYSSIFTPSQAYYNMRKKLDDQRTKLEENKQRRRNGHRPTTIPYAVKEHLMALADMSEARKLAPPNIYVKPSKRIL